MHPSAPTKIKFDRTKRSAFEKEVTQKVEHYFKKKGISKRGNSFFYVKGLISFLLVAICYLSIYLVPPTFGYIALCYIALGFFSVVMVFNLGHDAMHGAASKNPKINKLLGYTWNMVGISCYVWKLLHNYGHHPLTNVPGRDFSVGQTPILRLNPDMKHWKAHRFQHIYGPLMLSLVTLDLVLVKDFKMLMIHQFGNKEVTHSQSQWIRTILLKVFYLIYVLLLPILFLKTGAWVILLAFLLKHMVAGLFVAAVLLPTHLHTETYFPQPDEAGLIGHSWFDHQLEVTIDFSTNTPFVSWITGGTNYHIVHHMFPGVCHIHYPELTQIVKEAAANHGKVYLSKSWGQVVSDGIGYLKDLGTHEEVPAYYELRS